MENTERIYDITPYRDINGILYLLAQGIQKIFGNDLVGVYLTGSLSYGDFEEGRSDIDLVVVLKNPVPAPKLNEIKKLHEDAGQKYRKWANRVECSYVPLEMFSNVLPPKDPRPYVGAGKFYPAELFGNEWIINKYFLYENGIALVGPDFKTLAGPVQIEEVKKAGVRDFYKEWEPKTCDVAYLEDSHQQSYVVLNLCRILYAIANNGAVSKRRAAAWAKSQHPQWKDLIEDADRWRYGIEMRRQGEVAGFIRFAAERIGNFKY